MNATKSNLLTRADKMGETTRVTLSDWELAYQRLAMMDQVEEALEASLAEGCSDSVSVRNHDVRQDVEASDVGVGGPAVTLLRVKQAQFALADGRLDEAYDLLNRDSVRSHRLGQRLATKLVKAYVKRGGGHLNAGRLHEAMADCEKAGSVGGHAQEVAELRQRVAKQMEDKRREALRREIALAGAQRHAREGFFIRPYDN